ncbi:MAG: PH domain-containing protein [Acidobacteriota bacterium]
MIAESSRPLLEFAPAPAPSGWRPAFGVVVTLVALSAAAVTTLLVVVPSAINYRIGAGTLTIAARHGAFPTSRTVRLSDITNVEDVVLRDGRRTAGTSLPGFCAGHFRYAEIGPVWQATNCGRNVLLLRAAGAEKPILVSPRDPRAFREALATGGPGTFAPATVEPPRGWWVFTLLVAAPVLLAVLLPLLVFVAPGKLRYGIGPGVLEVRTLFRRRRFDLSAATARRVSPSRAFRIVGSAMPGYFTGTFWLEGARARVYATSLRHGMLVETPGRLFVTPADLDAFAEALSSAGARVE